MHVELAGVDHDVGPAFQILEQLPLVGDAFGDALVDRERVLASGGLVAPYEHVVGRIEEQHPRAGAHLPELGQRGDEVVDELTGPHVDHEREPLRALGAAPQLGDLGDQRRREVVDHEEAEILQHVGRGRAPGP